MIELLQLTVIGHRNIGTDGKPSIYLPVRYALRRLGSSKRILLPL